MSFNRSSRRRKSGDRRNRVFMRRSGFGFHDFLKYFFWLWIVLVFIAVYLLSDVFDFGYSVLIGLSISTFLMFGLDKIQAILNGIRIPEKFLYLFALLGGLPGAVLGMIVFSHKISKTRFLFWIALVAIFWVIVLFVLWNNFGFFEYGSFDQI